MRLGMWAVAGVCVLAAGTPAQAQSLGVLGGPNPSQLTYKPIDTSRVIASAPGLAAQQNRFNFSQIFNKFALPSFPAKRGISPVPPPDAFPSTRYTSFQMVGQPPLMLGQPRTKPYSIPTPFVPSVGAPVGPGSN